MRPCHAAHLASRMTPQPAILLEPFTGAAALPAAAWNLAPSAHVLSAGGAWRGEQQDLLDDAYFYCACQARQARWLHLVPFCRTLTCSRRADKWGTVRRLRGDAWPEGFGDPRTEAANEVARNAASPLRVVAEKVGYFKTENPWG